jgi:hypothetical protein
VKVRLDLWFAASSAEFIFFKHEQITDHTYIDLLHVETRQRVRDQVSNKAVRWSRAESYHLAVGAIKTIYSKTKETVGDGASLAIPTLQVARLLNRRQIKPCSWRIFILSWPITVIFALRSTESIRHQSRVVTALTPQLRRTSVALKLATSSIASTTDQQLPVLRRRREGRLRLAWC